MLCASLGFKSGSGSRFPGIGRFISEQSAKQQMLVNAAPAQVRGRACGAWLSPFASVRYRTAEIRAS
jgi:hypothetical protein